MKRFIKILLLMTLIVVAVVAATVLSACGPKEYTVTFVADGKIVGTRTYTEKNPAVIEPKVTPKEGYEGKWEDYTLTTGDVTVNAMYKTITYFAMFMADGEKIESIPFTVENKVIDEPAVPEKSGYVGSWEQYTLTTGDITVNAVYTHVSYSITFIADGAIVDKQTIAVNDKNIVEPEVPVKEGYTGSWEQYFITNEDITVHAVYQEILYSVVFWADGEKVEGFAYTVNNKEIKEPEVPFKEGYTGAWEEYELTTGDIRVNAVYTPNSHTITFLADNVIVDTRTYTAETKNIFEPQVPEKEGYTGAWEEYELTFEDITVKAIYTVIVYTVTYKADGVVVYEQNYTVENPTVLLPEVPEKIGYSGVWEEVPIIGGDVTINAIYTAVVYNITFEAYGEIVSSQSYTVENKELIEPEVPFKDGYVGMWENYHLTWGDIIVNALYFKSYNVTLVYNGATGDSSINEVTVLSNQPVGILPKPTKENYIFGGWYFGSQQITEETIWRWNDESAILTAKWHVITEGTQGLTYVLNGDGTARCTGMGTATDIDIEIASFYNEAVVTQIDDYAFKNCTNLYSVVIPETVTSIGKAAFQGCSILSSLTLPFVGANKNGTVNTHFGYIFGADNYRDNSSFVVSSLKRVVITTSENIPADAFSYCRNITDLEMSNTVKSIGKQAFYYCSSLTNISYSENLREIGLSAFESYSSIKCINYSGTIDTWIENEYGRGITYGSNQIELYINGELVSDVVIADGTKTIPDYAFANIGSIERITIPSSVTSIGSRAFSNCRKLSNVLIPNSVTKIGNQAFEYCHGLTDVTIPDSLIDIGDYIFYYCSCLKNINYIGTIESWCKMRRHEDLLSTWLGIAVKVRFNGEEITKIVVPDTITYIPSYAFYNFADLTDVTIPNGVIIIEENALRGCSELSSIIISGDVRIIAVGAFEGCDKLDKVYYEGNPDQWNNNISIENYNSSLIKATIYYYSETAPALNADGTAYDGNYWHYGENGEIVIWKKEQTA